MTLVCLFGISVYRFHVLVSVDFHPILEMARSGTSQGLETRAPLQQYGSSETVTSITFLPTEHSTLISGMGAKWIRIYDLRETQPPSLVIGTKAVYGLQPDPFHPQRFVSYSDEQVCLWDMRKSSDALLTLNERNMSRVAFSKHRPGYLAGFARDTNVIKLWDIRDSKIGDDFMPETDESVCWRIRSKETRAPLSSICWVPMTENRLLTVSRTGEMERVDVNDVPVFALSGNSHLATVFGGELQIENTTDSNDITQLMVQRAKNGYGLDASRNARLLDAEGLKEAWTWVSRMQHFSDSNQLTDANGKDLTYRAMTSLIQDARAGAEREKPAARRNSGSVAKKISTAAMAYTSQLNNQTSFIPITTSSMPDTLVPSTGQQQPQLPNVGLGLDDVQNPSPSPANLDETLPLPFPVFDSPQRRQALRVCGWDLTKDTLETLLDDLEKQNQYEKAAALALFHSNMSRCIKSLNEAGRAEYSIISAALAGYNAYYLTASGAQAEQHANSFQVWQDLCRSVSRQMQHPYLRAMLSFIACGGDFMPVLENSEIALKDRVGIALRFLSKDQLTAFLDSVTKKVASEGRVEGLLLTGFGFPNALDLLQAHVNRTGDIQTAVLLLSSCPARMFRDGGNDGLKAVVQLTNWVQEYIDFLDQLGLFHIRCQFDIQRRRFFAGQNARKSVFSMDASSPSPSYGQRASLPPPSSNTVDQALARNYNVPSQVYLRCNFCNSALSSEAMFMTSSLGMKDQRISKFLTTPTIPSDSSSGYSTPNSMVNPAILPRTKSFACPSCRKPLPRCSICLLPMGMRLDSVLNQGAGDDPIRYWFSWCQTCRHGGHAFHMDMWFREHRVCPVSDCQCHCSSLDYHQ